MFRVCVYPVVILAIYFAYTLHILTERERNVSFIQSKMSSFFSWLCTSISLQFLRHMLVHLFFSVTTYLHSHTLFLFLTVDCSFLLQNISFTLRKYCSSLYSCIIATNCQFKCVRQHAVHMHSIDLYISLLLIHELQFRRWENLE